ncbi:MAG: hypothetical protein E7295_10190 [Lachnospiraceae bacterium]|jgi:hypothetical protein|nr:hypothetical protein [Lachnospiraceae bacterium]
MKKEMTQEQGSIVTDYDPARLKAIMMYAKVKGVDVNKAMTDTLDRLFARCVPPSVQEFLSMTQGSGSLFSESGDGE